jgi:UPF0755 protein
MPPRFFVSQSSKNQLQKMSIIFLLFAFFSVAYLLRTINLPLSLKADVIYFEVEPGYSVARIARKLAKEGIYEYPWIFSMYARLRGSASSIQAGEYEISKGINVKTFLNMLVTGDIAQYRVTLIEGWTLDQALTAIWQSPNIRREVELINKEDIPAELQLDFNSAEGLFFPDTYFYAKGSTDIEILRRANQKMNEVLTEAWMNRLGALPYENSYEALIMASIIEKESGFGSERGDIAGVFVRRLELGMRLQSDPTVIYGMGEDYKGDIQREDLRKETAYNTYRIDGLPPTPIALAGMESILASLNPLLSENLYFVSKGDGTHYFSSTLEEHNAAVNRFQISPQEQSQ